MSDEPHRRPTVLVTNDDGIDAPGILALARALSFLDVQVIVAAPSTNMSGASAAIGPVDPSVPIRSVALPQLDVPAYAVAAPPAMIVVAALGGAMGEVPDAVASGVNAGYNLGRAVLHSGTVGAALTAQNLGLPAVAVSALPETDPRAAAAIAARVLAGMLRTGATAMINLNVPARADASTEVVATRLAHFGAVTAARGDSALSFQLTIDPDALGEPGTDAAAVRDGKVSATTLLGLTVPTDEAAQVGLRPVGDPVG